MRWRRRERRQPEAPGRTERQRALHARLKELV